MTDREEVRAGLGVELRLITPTVLPIRDGSSQKKRKRPVN